MELKLVAGALQKKYYRSDVRVTPTTSLLQRRIDLGITAISCSLKSSRWQLFSRSWKHGPALPRLLRAVKEDDDSIIEARVENESHKTTGIGGTGTVFGATSLIIGTSIGSGILALPAKTSPAGFVPSAVSIIICWAFLVVEALLVAEINVSLTQMKKRKRKRTKEKGKGLTMESSASSEEEEVATIMSFKTMAQETLGDLGGSLATVTYVFLGYTSMTAYASESGELLSHLISLPSSLLSIFFTAALASLIFFGGTRTTDIVNRWLTAFMIGLLVTIEATTASRGDWSVLMATEDWGKVPRAIPVIIFALVYHDIAPVICSYLDGDMKRIRSSILIGSLIPLISLLVWDGVVLSYSSQVDGVDPLELLLRGGNVAASTMAETFSILAVGTSLIGTLLGFSNFFQEQFYFLFRSHLPSSIKAQPLQEDNMPRASTDESTEPRMSRTWLELDSALNLSAVAVAVIPPLLISSSLTDAFSVATDIAGGYCMTVLYGVLPPAMAWSLRMQQSGITSEDGNACDCDGTSTEEEEEILERSCFDSGGKGYLSEVKPALVGAGLFATILVAEQLFQDVPFLFHL